MVFVSFVLNYVLKEDQFLYVNVVFVLRSEVKVEFKGDIVNKKLKRNFFQLNVLKLYVGEILSLIF